MASLKGMESMSPNCSSEEVMESYFSGVSGRNFATKSTSLIFSPKLLVCVTIRESCLSNSVIESLIHAN